MLDCVQTEDVRWKNGKLFFKLILIRRLYNSKCSSTWTDYLCCYHLSLSHFLSLYPQTLIQTCLMSAESAFNTSNFEMHHQSFEDLMIYFVCLGTQFLKDTSSRNCNSTLFQWKISEDIFYKVIRTYREREPIFHFNFQLYQM